MDTPAQPSQDASATALPYPYVPPSPALQGAAFGPLFKALAWAIVRLVEQRRQRHSGVATPAKPAKGTRP